METKNRTFRILTLIGLMTWAAGAAGQDDFCQVAGPACLSFDGVDDYVDLGNGPSLQLSQEVTVAAWVKMEPGNAGTWMGIAGKLSGNTYRGFGIGRYSNNGFIFFTGSGGYYLDGVYSRPFTDSEWHHVAGVRDGRVMDLFVDGRSAFFNPYEKPEFLDSGQNAFIGRQVSDRANHMFEGLLDDVRIYRRALSESEVAAAMKTLPGPDPTLAGYWNLDEGAGPFAGDSTGNGNLGRLASTAAAAGPTWFNNNAFCQSQPTQVTIAGVVRDTQGRGVPGVTLSLSDGQGSDTTDGSGRYGLTVPYGWSGSVTPSRTGSVFDPFTRKYTNLIVDRFQDNYVMTGAVSTYYVDGTAGHDGNSGHSPTQAFRTIQRGLDVAADGHTVIVLDGHYRGQGNRELNFNGKRLTLVSQNGAQATVIDGQNSYRAFVFNQGEGLDSIVDGFTMTQCRAYQGAAVTCENSSPLIVNCRMTANVSNFGGAVYLGNSDAQVVNCVLTGNTATAGPGGALRCENGYHQPVIRNCTVADNEAAGTGGGLWCRYSNVLVANSIFWNNQTAGAGQQLSAAYASLTVQYSDIQGGREGVEVTGGSLVWNPGNLDADPLFGDPKNDDYQLRSERGRYVPALDVWALDADTSPCIDGGDPADAVGDERAPNGERINMGAFGGTARASLTPRDCELVRDENEDGQIDYDDLFIRIDHWLTEWTLIGAPEL
jgi:hypothetical protein